MHLGLLEVNNEGIIVEAYDGFCQITEFSREELEGKNAIEVLLPKRGHHKMKLRQHLRQQGEMEVYEQKIKTKSGKLIWVLISAAPIYNEKKAIVGSIGIHLDISEQKKLQESLRQAKLLAEKSQRVEQEFLANMSHEIRTPLNSIIGITELMIDTKLNNEQKEYLEVIANSSEILQNLISDILDISKIEAGEWVREDRPFDLYDLLKVHQKTFSFRLQEKQVDVLAKVDPAISNYVVGDKSWLNQILMNLIGNAAKFTEKGTIEIVAKQIEVVDQTRLIEFSVIDTGIGMDAPTLKNIFLSFKQGGNTITKKYGGTGLGLAISKKTGRNAERDHWCEK